MKRGQNDVACDATAITKSEDALQATEENQTGIQCRTATKRNLATAATDDSSPSILREYHYSALRIFVYNIIGVAALIAFLGLLFLMS